LARYGSLEAVPKSVVTPTKQACDGSSLTGHALLSRLCHRARPSFEGQRFSSGIRKFSEFFLGVLGRFGGVWQVADALPTWQNVQEKQSKNVTPAILTRRWQRSLATLNWICAYV
jgi:hypothetical protein